MNRREFLLSAVGVAVASKLPLSAAPISQAPAIDQEAVYQAMKANLQAYATYQRLSMSARQAMFATDEREYNGPR
jgi:hypothetical protein